MIFDASKIYYKLYCKFDSEVEAKVVDLHMREVSSDTIGLVVDV